MPNYVQELWCLNRQPSGTILHSLLQSQAASKSCEYHLNFSAEVCLVHRAETCSQTKHLRMEVYMPRLTLRLCPTFYDELLMKETKHIYNQAKTKSS